MTQEQIDALSDMREAHKALSAIYDAERYLVKNLGAVHKTVCSFRLDVVKKYANEFTQAQNKVQDTGAVDALCETLSPSLNQ